MRVLLVHPPLLVERPREEDVRPMPIGLHYLGAKLISEGHRVGLINLFDAAGRQKEIEELLRRERPELLGFSILNANRWGALEMARLAKTLDPGVKTVLGGPAATFLWRHFLESYPEIDYVVLGEGEQTLSELAAHVGGGEPEERAAGILGLAWRGPNGPVNNPPRPPLADLDSLPNPARHFTYQHLVVSRGCPGRCTFCGSPRFWGTASRFHSPAYFVEQMRLLAEKGVGYFYVSDDTFTQDRERVLEICRLIRESGLQVGWQAISRVDRVDPGVLKAMRLAGCRQISYGVEHGSPRVRKLLGKPIAENSIKRAFHLTAAHGILPRAYFIYGCPGENRESIGQTLKLMDAIRPLAAIFYILHLFPGTALFESFKKKAGLSDDIWRQPIEDFMHWETDPDMTPEMVLEWGRELREAFQARLPEYVRALRLVDDPEMAPWHADFLSRLALTFTHGEYASLEGIPDKAGLAVELYRRALGYRPHQPAFLGLGALLQRCGHVPESLWVLEAGLEHFPGEAELSVCLAASLMHLGDHRRALALLEPHPDNPQARKFVEECRKVLDRQA